MVSSNGSIYTGNSYVMRPLQPPTRFSENPKENLGKEPTGAEFIPGNSSEEETSGTEESDEDIKLGNKPFLKKQKEQLRHIYDLIEDVDSKTQTVRDEQKVIEDNKENEYREHNVEQYEIQLEWLDDQRDLLKDLLEATQHWYKSIRRLSRYSIFRNRDKHQKCYKQRAAYRLRVESSEQNLQKHQVGRKQLNLRHEQQRDVQPETPKPERRTTTFPGGYIHTPEYRRTAGTDPTSSLFPTTEFPGLSLSDSSTKTPEEQTTAAKGKTKEQTTIENQGTEPPQEAMEERRSQTPGIGQRYSGYRVPKPRTLQGEGDNEDRTTIDSWIREVKSHFNLEKTPKKTTLRHCNSG
jgi:hypothetical protein